MKPVSPVYKIYKDYEVVYAKDQPEYLNLPVLRTPQGICVSRWQLSWRERLKVLLTGSIYLSMLTFNKPLQPIKLTTEFEETGY